MSNTSFKNSKKISSEIKVGNVLKVDVDDPKADYDIEELAKILTSKYLTKKSKIE